VKTEEKYKIVADLSMKIVYLVLLIFILGIIFIIYYFSKPTVKKEEKTFVCGNAVLEEQHREKVLAKYGKNYDIGEKLFKQNCAMCHTLGKNKITGPGLEGIASRVPNEKWLLNYILNPDSLFKQKDAYTLKLRNEYPNERMPKSDLTVKEVTEIISYIKTTPARIVY
jgi:cytochrome c2